MADKEKERERERERERGVEELDDVRETEDKSVADPKALGLLGLAMATLVASSAKLGLTRGTSYIIPWAIFLGGFTQLFACVNSSKRKNIFGETLFGGYAFFWLSIGFAWLIKNGIFGNPMAYGADERQLGIAFVGYLIFSISMTIAATQTDKVMFSMFVFIDIMFIGLTLSSFEIMEKFSYRLAGYAELAVALLAFYGSASVILKDVFEKEYLPVGKPLIIKKEKIKVEE